LLSPFEPAWKLHGRIVPRQISVVPAERVWTIDNLAVPSWGEQKELNLEREIDGVRLRLGTLVGGAIGSGDDNNREDGPANGNQSGSRNDCPRFDLTATSSHRDFDVIVRVSSNGKELRTIGSTGLRPLSREITRVFKKLPAHSKVKIEVGVSRPVHVEFLLDPKEFRAESEKSARTREAS
jgi:hypothetical protein